MIEVSLTDYPASCGRGQQSSHRGLYDPGLRLSTVLEHVGSVPAERPNDQL